MKYWVLFIIVVIFSLNSIGQNAIEVTYNVRTNFAVDYKTTALLTTNLQKSYYIERKSNASIKDAQISYENNNMDVLLPDTDNRPKVFVDFKTKVLYSNVPLPMKRKNMLIKESLENIPWEILDEFKYFEKLKCQKASGNFRGRTYTVWFATDIPAPFGPWKLNGLPGLIIDVQDDKNQVYFSATKISFPDKATSENFPTGEGAIMLQKFVDETIPETFQEMESRINSKTDRHTTISISLPDRNLQKEIIYEWEKEKEE